MRPPPTFRLTYVFAGDYDKQSGPADLIETPRGGCGSVVAARPLYRPGARRAGGITGKKLGETSHDHLREALRCGGGRGDVVRRRPRGTGSVPGGAGLE